MNRKRRVQDGVKNVLAYISAGIAILGLLTILFYVFQKGVSTLSWKMLTNDYWAETVT